MTATAVGPNVVRLRAGERFRAVLDGQVLAYGVEPYWLQCIALTTAKRRCRIAVERYGQTARWDDADRYDIDASARGYLPRRYGSVERYLATFRQQRCPLHVDQDNPDAVPRDSWPATA